MGYWVVMGWIGTAIAGALILNLLSGCAVATCLSNTNACGFN